MRRLRAAPFFLRLVLAESGVGKLALVDVQ